MKLLNDKQVETALDWSNLIDALERAYASLKSDDPPFLVPQRSLISRESGSYLTMPIVDAAGWFGVKQVSVLPGNSGRGLPTVQAFFTLFDETGTPAMAAHATSFTYLRTAAVSAVAARRLAPRDATSLLVVGTGGLAPWMAEAHSQVRSYRRLQVWGRRREAVSNVIARLEARRSMLPNGIVIEAAADLETAVAESDVISLATTSSTPLVSRVVHGRAQHLDAVGAFTPDMVEVGPSAVKASEVWVDDLPSAKAKAGDLLQAERAGWTFNAVRGALSDLVTGGGRTDEATPTMFKAVGTAISDMVFAKLLYATTHGP